MISGIRLLFHLICIARKDVFLEKCFGSDHILLGVYGYLYIRNFVNIFLCVGFFINVRYCSNLYSALKVQQKDKEYILRPVVNKIKLALSCFC